MSDKLPPISQVELCEKLLPLMQGSDCVFRKKAPIMARPAETGELVETITSDGKETEQTAKPGQFVAENQTDSLERYLISTETLQARYEPGEKRDDIWQEYLPTARVRAILVDANLARRLNRSTPFEVMADWGSPQRVEAGDMLVSPLPELREIYRIAKKEFGQTYKPD